MIQLLFDGDFWYRNTSFIATEQTDRKQDKLNKSVLLRRSSRKLLSGRLTVLTNGQT